MDELIKLRSKIDIIDEKIMSLIAERLNLAGAIGRYKKKVGKPVKDDAREIEKIEKLAGIGLKYGIDRKTIEMIWEQFFKASYTKEK